MTEAERKGEIVVGALRRRLTQRRSEQYSGEMVFRVFLSNGGVTRVRCEFAAEESLREEQPATKVG